MELVDVARSLVALPPEEFTAARTARAREARAAGDRTLASAVAALRKPALPAWLVDRLVAEEPDLVREALGLGRRMAHAQATGDGAALRGLGREQHALLGRVRDAVTAAAQGRAVSDAVLVQVEQTVRAAMADEGAAAAVATGLLVAPLASTGFEAVDVEGAVAVPGAPPLLDAPPAAGVPDASPAADVDAGGTGRTDDGGTVTLRGARRRATGERASERSSDRPATVEHVLPGRRTRRRPTASDEPAAEAPTYEAPTDAAPTDEAPTDAAPTDEAPTDEVPAEDAPARRDRPRRASTTRPDRDERERAARDRAAREASERAQQARRQADDDVAAAQAAAEAAREALERAEAAAGEAADREAGLAEDAEELARRLGDVQRDHAAARVAHRRADAARRAAARDATTADGRLERARTRRDALDATGADHPDG